MQDDRLNDIIRRANGQVGPPPGLGTTVQPTDRPSGWMCPRCGSEAPQRWEPITFNGEPIGGIKWLTLEDGSPMPVRVMAQEVTGHKEDGSPQIYETQHCFNCFNSWQRRKMMEDIRQNVPQLVRKSDG